MEIKKPIQTLLLAATIAAPGISYKPVEAKNLQENSPTQTLALLPSPELSQIPPPENTTPKPPPPTVELLPDLLPKFIDAEAKFADPLNPFKETGDRLTMPWETEGANQVHVTFQRIDLVLDLKTGEIRPGTLLEKMHADGLDNKLANGELGVIVPEKKDLNDGSTNLKEAKAIRENKLKTPSYFRNYLKSQKAELGAPTSPVLDSGPFQTLRLQGAAIQYWKDTGKFEHVLIGDAAAKAGIIPKDALLTQPVEDTDILKMLTPTETLQDLIAQTAARLGITPAQLNGLTYCESHDDPNAYNPLGFYGLGQLDAKKAVYFRRHNWDMFGPPKHEGWRDPKKQLVVIGDLAIDDKGFTDWPNCGKGLTLGNPATSSRGLGA